MHRVRAAGPRLAGWLLLWWLVLPAAQARDLVIAGIPEEPLRWIGQDDRVTGFDVDVIDHIMRKLGVGYRVVLVDSSARLEMNARAVPAQYDMVFTYSYTDARAEYLTYAKESHISFNWNFFLLKENEGKFVFNTYADLANRTIGITRGMSYSDEFLKAIEEVPLKVDSVATNRVQLDKLLAKRFDLVPLNTKTTLYEARERGILNRITYLPKPLKDKAYFNTFVTASTYPKLMELAGKYDDELKQMKRDGTLSRLMIKYGFTPGQ